MINIFNTKTLFLFDFSTVKPIIRAASYLCLSIVIFGCSDDKASGSHSAGAVKQLSHNNKTIPVEVAIPTVGLAASFYVTTATIEPSSDAKINARTVGVVQKILHEEGDDVNAGDVLLVLDDVEQRLRLRQAKQKFASAKREYNRLNKMKKAGVVSSTEWETTENNYNLAQTEQKLAEIALSYTQVAAPFSGRVVRREVDLGTHVAQGELLFRMMSIDPLLVRVHVPANRLGQVAVGQKVTLTIDGADTPLDAVVSLISPIVDPDSGTIKVTLNINKYPETIRPGDFTEISMVTNQHENALLVASVALIEERGQNFLYVIKDGIAHKSPVTVGYVMTELTEISAGISANDQVVVKGNRHLNDQVLVEILDDKKDSKNQTSQSIQKNTKKSSAKSSKKSNNRGSK